MLKLIELLNSKKRKVLKNVCTYIREAYKIRNNILNNVVV